MEKNTTVGSFIYEKIKHDIIFGTIRPGHKLRLNELKDRYEASVSTLREMLNRLASDGFVVAEEQRGFFVAPVSRTDLIEISRLRILLECTALRVSINSPSTEWEGNLVSAHHKLHSIEKLMLAGDQTQKDVWKQYDWEFHLALIQNCSNANLLRLHETIYNKYLRYQMLVLTNREQSGADEHKAIRDAVLAHDSDTAVTLLQEHINNGLEHTLGQLTS